MDCFKKMLFQIYFNHMRMIILQEERKSLLNVEIKMLITLLNPVLLVMTFSSKSTCNFCADEFGIFINIVSFGKVFEVSG